MVEFDLTNRYCSRTGSTAQATRSTRTTAPRGSTRRDRHHHTIALRAGRRSADCAGLSNRGALRPLGLDEVRLTGGLWGDLHQLNADVIIEHCYGWMSRIGSIPNFDRAAGVAGGAHDGIELVDSEVYKLLEAMAWELGTRSDDLLEARYRDLVQRIGAAQEADGYLHTSFGRGSQRPRYSDLEWGHELYCFGHLIQAAVARLRTGHDDDLPAIARRLTIISISNSDRTAGLPSAGTLRWRWRSPSSARDRRRTVSRTGDAACGTARP